MTARKRGRSPDWSRYSAASTPRSQPLWRSSAGVARHDCSDQGGGRLDSAPRAGPAGGGPERGRERLVGALAAEGEVPDTVVGVVHDLRQREMAGASPVGPRLGVDGGGGQRVGEPDVRSVDDEQARLDRRLEQRPGVGPKRRLEQLEAVRSRATATGSRASRVVAGTVSSRSRRAAARLSGSDERAVTIPAGGRDACELQREERVTAGDDVNPREHRPGKRVAEMRRDHPVERAEAQLAHGHATNLPLCLPSRDGARSRSASCRGRAIPSSGPTRRSANSSAAAEGVSSQCASSIAISTGPAECEPSQGGENGNRDRAGLRRRPGGIGELAVPSRGRAAEAAEGRGRPRRGTRRGGHRGAAKGSAASAFAGRAVSTR